jgi:hypothetical protein
LKRRLVAAIVGIGAVLSAALYYWIYISGGVENGQRLYINAVVLGFMEIRSEIEQELKLHQEIGGRDSMQAKWQKSLGSIYGVSKVVFGRTGQVAVFSDHHNVDVLIEPSVNVVTKWQCATYPKVDFESLCNKLKEENAKLK